MVFLSNFGDTEVAGFGIADDPSDPLLVTDFVLVKQTATSVSFEFDPSGLGEYMEQRVAEGLNTNEFMRIWIHTHPCGPTPSSVDWDAFGEILGRSDWSVMMILGRNAETHAVLQFTSGPGGCFQIPVQIAWDEEFEATSHSDWANEHRQMVHKPVPVAIEEPKKPKKPQRNTFSGTHEFALPFEVDSPGYPQQYSRMVCSPDYAEYCDECADRIPVGCELIAVGQDHFCSVDCMEEFARSMKDLLSDSIPSIEERREKASKRKKVAG